MTAWLRLWLINRDLIIVIVISIPPVHVVARILLVWRWWVVVNVVVAFVAVASVVVDNFGVDVTCRLRRTTLPLAIAALERRDVCVAAMPTCWNIVTEITYIFRGASRRRVCARVCSAILRHGPSAR